MRTRTLLPAAMQVISQDGIVGWDDCQLSIDQLIICIFSVTLCILLFKIQLKETQRDY